LDLKRSPVIAFSKTSEILLPTDTGGVFLIDNFPAKLFADLFIGGEPRYRRE
jgi:hypothetical protein